jgi:hypothetical protein
LKPLSNQSLARGGAVCCAIAAEATVRANLDSLDQLRRHPGPIHGEPPPAALLKHADEQTVAGLSAVYQAIARDGLQDTCFCDWGVVAAPRFLGRPTMAAALQRFVAEGAWGVSPHLIPHRSLHSVSGTVSQALKIHGPNFGVGGGPDGTVEALLAATALLERMKLPGVWVVLTCLSPQLPPDETGRMPPGTEAVGFALALTPNLPPTPPQNGGGRGRALRLHIIRGVPDAEILARINRELGGYSSCVHEEAVGLAAL